jgi:LysR family glycine cleavage system transcriptional activator
VGRDSQSYWLVYAEGRGNTPKIRAFRDWILAEVKRDAGGKGASS